MEPVERKRHVDILPRPESRLWRKAARELAERADESPEVELRALLAALTEQTRRETAS